MWSLSKRTGRVLLACMAAFGAGGGALLACTSKSSSPAVTCHQSAPVPDAGPLPDCYKCQTQVCADAASTYATACSDFISCVCACETDSGQFPCATDCPTSSTCSNADVELSTCNLVVVDPTGPCATACGHEVTTGACMSLQVCCPEADAAVQASCYSIVASGSQSACAAALDGGLVGNCN